MDLNRVTSRNPQYTDTRNLSNPSYIYVRLQFEIGSNSCWQRRVSQLDLANFHALEAHRTWFNRTRGNTVATCMRLQPPNIKYKQVGCFMSFHAVLGCCNMFQVAA
jgi:hypothetical protein